MSDVDKDRRWLLNMGGAAVLASALPLGHSSARGAGLAPASAPRGKNTNVPPWAYISPLATRLAEYVSTALDRELPDQVIATAKLHVLDTIAAMVAGSRLRPGELAARYVAKLGGTPEAMVIGTDTLSSVVNATFANAMAAHADESDDTSPIGPFHAGCGCVPAALATAEYAGRNGMQVLRAVTLGYDIGTRLILSLGGTKHNPSCMTNTFAVTATCAALLRLTPAQVRYAFSYAGQQASGIGYWDRDIQHVEKAFDFGGMGARNGVMAATMVAMGFTGVEDPFSGSPNIFSVLGEKPAPDKMIADLGTRFYILGTTIKQWGAGEPLQSVLDNITALIKNAAVRPGNIKRIIVEVPSGDVHIVNNNPNPGLCVQHLIALTIVDRGATFWSIHDVARMHDPIVLAVRRLVELVPSHALQMAKTRHLTVIRIQTSDGRWFSHAVQKLLGTAQDPMDAQQVEAKALDLTGRVLGVKRARQLIATMRGFDRLGAVSALRPLLQT
ncbi:MAG: MmgE/PrpD family protein [Chloroflexota bacterium]